MFFNYLSDVDKVGVDYEKLKEFQAVVFCCLVKSAEICDESVFDSLEALGRLDNKFYAIFKSPAVKSRLENMLSVTFDGIEIPRGDYFLILNTRSLISGEAVGLFVVPVEFKEDEDPDKRFIAGLKELRGEVSRINRKEIIYSVGKKALDELLDIL